MKSNIVTTVLVIATLSLPVLALAAEDTDADRSHPAAFVKDSVITTKVKSKLAAEHISVTHRSSIRSPTGDPQARAGYRPGWRLDRAGWRA